MKSLTNRFFLFAASAVFFGTTAFGQTTMKADVPFAFSIPGGAGEAAGNYVINLDTHNTGKVLRLYNFDTHHGTLAITYSAGGGPRQNVEPRLVFRCGDEGCALSEVWTANGGYALAHGKIRPHQYLASIPLTIQQGN
jgi:hypothetical protein